jgi:hypothetical protein
MTGKGDRRQPLRRTGRLRSRSEERATLMREQRAPEVERLRQTGGTCLIGPLLRGAGIDIGCRGAVEGLHERRKRSAGGSLVNKQNLIPACNRCNGWIEDEPAAARDLFGTALVVREGDPEWLELGRRKDRLAP